MKDGIYVALDVQSLGSSRGFIQFYVLMVKKKYWLGNSGLRTWRFSFTEVGMGKMEGEGRLVRRIMTGLPRQSFSWWLRLLLNVHPFFLVVLSFVLFRLMAVSSIVRLCGVLSCPISLSIRIFKINGVGLRPLNIVFSKRPSGPIRSPIAGHTFGQVEAKDGPL